MFYYLFSHLFSVEVDTAKWCELSDKSQEHRKSISTLIIMVEIFENKICEQMVP